MYDYTYNYGIEPYTITSGQSDLFAAVAGAIAVIWILAMIFSVLVVISTWKIFVKAGQKGWKSIIPIYNNVVLLEIAKLPIWYIILFFIPIANIFVTFIINIELAHKFGKSTGFGVACAFFPIICYPILAFGKAKYQGDDTIASTTNYQSNQTYESNSNVASEPQPIENPIVNMEQPVINPTVVSEPQPASTNDTFNQTSKIEVKTCPQCGSQVDVNSKYCNICGYHF